MTTNIKKIISEMTLEEKASLCSGDDFWNTKAVERLGIPPHQGQRRPPKINSKDLGFESREAVSFFPPRLHFGLLFYEGLI